MRSSLEIDFAGQRLVLDAGLGLYWPARETLVVSDLHLEKATYLAQFGFPLAPYDTLDTLNRLSALVSKYQPRTLILLGDSFHDRHAWERLDDSARQHLLAICARVDHCHLIEGNHDIDLAEDGKLQFAVDLEMDGILFRHIPETSLRPQVIGHFHPKLRTSLHGHRLTGKAFAVNPNLLILPAFGTYTGGLDLMDEVFTTLFGNAPFDTYMVFRNTVTRTASGKSRTFQR